MLRPTSLSLAFLLAGFSYSAAEVLVNTRLHPAEAFAIDAPFQLNLTDHFQRYPDPGPVATIQLYMPVQAGFRDIFIEYTYDAENNIIPAEDGATLNLMTYELLLGGSYDNAYGVYAEEFVWQTYAVQYQLMADQAPVTVANFMTYADRGVYKNTIVHRSDTTINVVQSGALRLYDTDEYLLEWIETLPPIVFEQTINNTIGTLAMARQSALNTATSQFYINLADNTNVLSNAYSVFGQLVNQETDLPLLQEMGDARIYNLTSIFRTAPVSTIPMYTPFWDDKGSYVRFQDISVNSGNPDGVTYNWEFVDTLPEDATDEEKEEQAANQAVFDIALEGSTLTVGRHDTGIAVINVSGSYSGQDRSFDVFLTGYNPDALDAFPVYTIEQGGWMTSNWYGRMQADTFPAVFHENHGYQGIHKVVNPVTGGFQYYIFDSRLDSWIYTTSGLYPILYVFNMDTWLEYVEGTGNGLNMPRWFWDYGAEGWINDWENN